jgi:hypothetical protein
MRSDYEIENFVLIPALFGRNFPAQMGRLIHMGIARRKWMLLEGFIPW